MKFKNIQTGSIIEPNCKEVEELMINSEVYEAVKEQKINKKEEKKNEK